MSVQFATSPVEILAWQRLVLAEPSLSHTASRIAASLSLYINSQSGLAWPSLRTLARVSSTSYSSVKRAIKQLSTLRLVQVERGHAGRSNRYRAVLRREPDAPAETADATGAASDARARSLSESAVSATSIARGPVDHAAEASPTAAGHGVGGDVQTAPEHPETLATSATDRQDAPRPASDIETCTDLDTEIVQVVEHLNQRTGGCFPSAPGTATYRILRRALREHSPATLCAVIDLKAAQWGGTEQARYVRPSTLFAPVKLEAYLSEIHQHQAPPLSTPTHRCVMPEPAPTRAPREMIQGYLDQMYRALSRR